MSPFTYSSLKGFLSMAKGPASLREVKPRLSAGDGDKNCWD